MLQRILAQLCQLFTPITVVEASNQLRTPKHVMSQGEVLSAMRSARRECDAVGLAIIRFKGSESAEGNPDVERCMVHCHLELRLCAMHMLSATEPTS
jgi:hypothetical protein